MYGLEEVRIGKRKQIHLNLTGKDVRLPIRFHGNPFHSVRHCLPMAIAIGHVAKSANKDREDPYQVRSRKFFSSIAYIAGIPSDTDA